MPTTNTNESREETYSNALVAVVAAYQMETSKDTAPTAYISYVAAYDAYHAARATLDLARDAYYAASHADYVARTARRRTRCAKTSSPCS